MGFGIWVRMKFVIRVYQDAVDMDKGKPTSKWTKTIGLRKR